MTSTESTTCKEHLQPRDRGDAWSRARICGRPVEAGTTRCKLHNRAAARRAEADRAFRERTSASDRAQREAYQRAQRLLVAVGREGGAFPYYRTPAGPGLGSYTGGVVLTADAADALLDLLAAREAELAERTD